MKGKIKTLEGSFMEENKDTRPLFLNEELSPEMLDSLSQWAQMEGYTHHPEDLAKLFMGHIK